MPREIGSFDSNEGSVAGKAAASAERHRQIAASMITESCQVASPPSTIPIEMAARKAMGAADVVTGVRALNRDVAIPSLRQLNIEADRYESLLEKMAADALASGSPANNPRTPTAAEIVTLYRHVYTEGNGA